MKKVDFFSAAYTMCSIAYCDALWFNHQKQHGNKHFVHSNDSFGRNKHCYPTDTAAKYERKAETVNSVSAFYSSHKRTTKISLYDRQDYFLILRITPRAIPKAAAKST